MVTRTILSVAARSDMHESSSVPATGKYRTSLRAPLPGRRCLENVTDKLSFLGKNATREALESACDKIDWYIVVQRASKERIRGYVKASLGLESKCDNEEFKLIASQLSRNANRLGFEKVTRSSVDLLAKIYISVVQERAAFPDGHHLNQDGFIRFVAEYAEMEETEVRARIPSGYLREISKTRDERAAEESESEGSEVKIRLNNAESWVEGSVGPELDGLPPEVIVAISGFLPSPLALAATDWSLRRVLSREIGVEQLIKEASAARSLDDIEAWLEVGGRRHEDFEKTTSRKPRLVAVLASQVCKMGENDRLSSFKLLLEFTLDSLPPAQWGEPLIAVADAIFSLRRGDEASKPIGKILQAVRDAKELHHTAGVEVLAALAGSRLRGGRWFDEILAIVDSKWPGERERFAVLSLSRLKSTPRLVANCNDLAATTTDLLILMLTPGKDGMPPPLRVDSLFELGVTDAPSFTFQMLMESVWNEAGMLVYAFKKGFDDLSSALVPTAFNTLIAYGNHCFTKRGNHFFTKHPAEWQYQMEAMQKLIELLANSPQIGTLPREQRHQISEELARFAKRIHSKNIPAYRKIMQKVLQALNAEG